MQAERRSFVAGPFWLLVVFAGAFVWSLYQAEVWDKTLVNHGGWGLVGRFARASLRPDLSPDIVRLVVPSALITLAYAVCGTALSLLIGVVGGVWCSEVWWQLRSRQSAGRRGGSLVGWLGIRGALSVPRAIHEAVWGLFFIHLFGLDPLSAVLAIAVPFGAITAKVFAEILDETPREALQALHNNGAPALAALAYGLLPQAFGYLLSYAFYRFECALRSAAVLGLIGAGGLGYQILLSLQSLRYEQVWTFLYALILLVGLTDAWSSLLNRRLNVTSGVGLHAGGAGSGGRGVWDVDRAVRYSLLFAVLLIVFSFWYVKADVTKLASAQTAQRLARIGQDVLGPRWESAFAGDLVHLGAQTLGMSILAITIAGGGALLLSFPAAANFVLPGGLAATGARDFLPKAALLVTTRGLLLVTRAFGESIWVLVALLVLFPGVLPGAVGLGLYNLGVLGRLMAEVVENADNRPLRALKAQGASASQVFWYGVLPAVLPRCLSYLLYRWEVCIRATAVVGIVGAGGLGRRLSEQLASFDYPRVAATLIVYTGLIFLVDLISALIRRSVR